MRVTTDGWVVYGPGEEVRCPNPDGDSSGRRRNHPRSGSEDRRQHPRPCNRKMGEVEPGTLVRIRLAPPAPRTGGGEVRHCPGCGIPLQVRHETVPPRAPVHRAVDSALTPA